MPPKLYLIPTPLADDAPQLLPAVVLETVRTLDYFICEKAKTARKFIKTIDHPKPFSELFFEEIDGREPSLAPNFFLENIKKGRSIGLVSEAGCPGVADPGAEIVALAHQKKVEVVPLVGPSSILLALMASGMNGQKFCFHGYLSPKRPELATDLRRLETESQRQKQTQIFIETPYRNHQFIETALASLHDDTFFCIATDLTAPTQYVHNQRVSDWKKSILADFHKRPTIFLIFRK
jgi:16S rRNA (cytidine1402-2'-O)-methyltransferase